MKARAKLRKHRSQDIDWDTEMSRNRDAFARSRSIDQQIDEEREKRQNEIQLLILGGASSGKSTFIKQLRLHQGDGFPEPERAIQTKYVYENLTDGFNIILDHMKEQNIQCETPENQNFAAELQASFPKCNHYYVPLASSPGPPARGSTVSGSSGGGSESGGGGGVGGGGDSAAIPVSPIHKEFHPRHNYSRVREYRTQLLRLWRDANVQRCLLDRDNFKHALVMAEEYFLENIERVLTAGYVPTIQDILYIRKPTVGVQEHSFTIDGLSYRVIDVAGQKSQRKKWIHFFEAVTAVTFFSPLSGYCETLEEDPSLNSLQDSLTTFRDLVCNPFLEKTDFILFLNKKDIFETRMKKHPLSLCFPKFKGGKSVESGTKFIKDEFIRCKPVEKQLYVHVSCATNIDLMKKLIKDVMEIIIEINMRKASAPF